MDSRAICDFTRPVTDKDMQLYFHDHHNKDLDWFSVQYRKVRTSI
jgi:hypothetical protein